MQPDQKEPERSRDGITQQIFACVSSLEVKPHPLSGNAPVTDVIAHINPILLPRQQDMEPDEALRQLRNRALGVLESHGFHPIAAGITYQPEDKRVSLDFTFYEKDVERMDEIKALMEPKRAEPSQSL